MDENRYHEILPVAYMAAAFRSGGKPSPRDVGLSARAIEAVENPKSAAYRIALATAFPVTIVSVKRVTVSLGNGQGEKFIIAFDTLSEEPKRQDIPSPLLSNWNLGQLAKAIWDRWEPNGTNSWVGKRMMLYKHNDPPREGDKSSAGYRCCVYAEPLD